MSPQAEFPVVCEQLKRILKPFAPKLTVKADTMDAYYPELLKGISPELKKHMQGKSCFNFKKVEPDLFKELADLTLTSIEQLRAAKDRGEI